MSLLEIFVHTGCLSEQRARVVAKEMEELFPELHILVCPEETNVQRISELELLVLPAFVMDGTLLAVGVPRTDWLVREIQKHGMGKPKEDVTFLSRH